MIEYLITYKMNSDKTRKIKQYKILGGVSISQLKKHEEKNFNIKILKIEKIKSYSI